MTIQLQSLLIRWSFIAGLLLIGLWVSYDLIAHPAVIATAGEQAPVYLLLLVTAMLIYGWFALFQTRSGTVEARIALQRRICWGLLCGGVWFIELLVANLLGPQIGWLYFVLYYGSAFTGYLLPGLAVGLSAWRTGRIESGIVAGLLTGMCGGLMIWLVAIVLDPLFLRVGQHDPQIIRAFEHSGLPDLTTYLVGDTLAGLIVHLWLGLLTGFCLGLVCGALGKAFTNAPGSSPERRYAS
jgi:hypothetical protein